MRNFRLLYFPFPWYIVRVSGFSLRALDDGEQPSGTANCERQSQRVNRADVVFNVNSRAWDSTERCCRRLWYLTFQDSCAEFI